MADFQFNFEKLEAWQVARKLVYKVYNFFASFRVKNALHFATKYAALLFPCLLTLPRAIVEQVLKIKFIFLRLHLVRCLRYIVNYNWR